MRAALTLSLLFLCSSCRLSVGSPIVSRIAERIATHQRQRPFVLLSYATTLNGMLSIAGQQLAISNAEHTAIVHGLRGCCEGIVVGGNTLMCDNPRLNCRLDGGSVNPRVVFALLGRESARGVADKLDTLRVMKNGEGREVVFVMTRAVAEEVGAFGGDVLVVDEEDENGLIDVEKFVEAARERYRVKSLMVEGGGKVLGSFLGKQGLVDTAAICISSSFVTGREGVRVEPRGNSNVTEMFKQSSFHGVGKHCVVFVGEN